MPELGQTATTGNRWVSQGTRGFKSPPLRQQILLAQNIAVVGKSGVGINLVNKPGVQTMAKIARALGVSIEDLLK